MGQYPSKSVLQENIKFLREETWEAIHREIIGYAEEEKIETGRKVRVDATCVETNIHYPTDSSLLSDGYLSPTGRSERNVVCWVIRAMGFFAGS